MGTWLPAQPSAPVVQHHYVNARTHDINTQFADKYKTATMVEFEKDLASRLKGVSKSKKSAYCADAYDHLTRVLQSRDLTINLKAASWFSKENPYESYAQMYERATAGGRMILDDSDALNPAEIRVAADDRVTFPTQWAGAQSPGQRGLAPGTQSPQAIMSRMMAGKKLVPIGGNTKGLLNPVPKTGGTTLGYESPNIRFNPKTKQVFAALNYGRRPHGSSTQYGMSYLILNKKFKVDALYYPEDTFYLPGTDFQVSYQTLGAIYLKAKPGMRQAIVGSCFDGIRLPDTADGQLLMEAHIFQEVRFADGVSELKLEPCNPGIMRHAKIFCDKWGIQLSINLL
jgi:hypothetical protein